MIAKNVSIKILLALYLSILCIAFSSCGGGGGGGGATGPAAEPTSTSTSTSQQAETVPVADLSSEAEIISFKFEKTKNPATLSEVEDDLIGAPSSSSALVVQTAVLYQKTATPIPRRISPVWFWYSLYLRS